MNDIRAEAAVFAAAATWVTRVVASVPASSWEGPALGEWSMRSLVGHTSRALTTVEQYLPRRAETEDILAPVGYFVRLAHLTAAADAQVAQRGVDAGVALGPAPAEAFAAIADRVTALVAGTGEALITTPAGGMRLSTYLPTRTFELVVHGLDIASSAGIESDPPAPAMTSALHLAAALAEATGRASVLVRAITGRTALPSGFTVLP